MAAMADAWKKTDGDLIAVYGAMLDHPAAWRDEGAKARQPFDYVVAGLRALNAGSGDGAVGEFMQAYQDVGDGGDAMMLPEAMAGQGSAMGGDTSAMAPDPEHAAASKRRKAFQRGRWGRARCGAWASRHGCRRARRASKRISPPGSPGASLPSGLPGRGAPPLSSARTRIRANS